MLEMELKVAMDKKNRNEERKIAKQCKKNKAKTGTFNTMCVGQRVIVSISDNCKRPAIIQGSIKGDSYPISFCDQTIDTKIWLYPERVINPVPILMMDEVRHWL